MAGADTGILELPYQAAGAIGAKRFVVLAAEQKVAQAGAGAEALGVARVGISATEAARGKGTAVHVHGVIFVEAGAAIPLGAKVQSDAQGRAIVAAGGAVVGKALEVAAAAGEYVPVLLAGGVYA